MKLLALLRSEVLQSQQIKPLEVRTRIIAMSSIEAKEFVLAGVVMKRLLSGKQTNGQFCLFENISGGNTKTPIHVHAEDDETIYVIEGELTAAVNGKAHRLTAGQSIFLKRGTPHQLMNMSGRLARYVLIDTPALFDRFIEEAGHELREGEVIGPPTPEELDRLNAACPKFGITLLPDWSAED
ncbi:MAG TPA: cupin domain-containing protein [Sinorhizobium sp.]|nr:cupin domain-containing protein [Sinorhizobium sp.]